MVLGYEIAKQVYLRRFAFATLQTNRRAWEAGGSDRPLNF